jgi:ATP-dependent DNA ligase
MQTDRCHRKSRLQTGRAIQRLWSRNGRNWSQAFRAITAALRALPVEQIVLDGEAMAHCDEVESPQ